MRYSTLLERVFSVFFNYVRDPTVEVRLFLLILQYARAYPVH